MTFDAVPPQRRRRLRLGLRLLLSLRFFSFLRRRSLLLLLLEQTSKSHRLRVLTDLERLRPLDLRSFPFSSVSQSPF